VDPCYFCASNESVLSLMKRGIWYEMAMNSEINPINSSSVVAVKSDGSVINLTDVKIQKIC